ncbi:MAG: type II toxin-antitoxin system HicB family antitoxin [Dysgonamonadaceae bacterium]|nr:type II toxin-antitoxin system HicB family antitoxin [Dysgonamonadaceae bacterium]
MIIWNCAKTTDENLIKSYSGTLNIRISSDIHCRVAMAVASKGTSISSFILNSIEKELQAAY